MDEKRRVFDVRAPGKTSVDPSTIIPESMQVRIIEASDGVPVASFVKEFGGYEGVVIDPIGKEHSVSLEPWRNADPEKTKLVLEYEFRVRKGGGR